MGDTVAAIATARGVAALSVVRLTGPEAIPIAASRFAGKDLGAAAGHTAHFGRVFSAAGEEIDQIVAVVYRAPNSATGEDVVEMTCHGGDFAAQLVLETLLDGGARLAEPGEFTRRAFVNGKLDLAQAEAVAELIHATSTLAHRVSLSHLEGRYSERLRSIREELLGLVALLELELDFSEEDVEFADRDRLGISIGRAEELLEELIGSYRIGQLLRDGIRVVIAGRPNAGKSTLLNALLGRDRAIVSPTPGTTRDEIEGEAEIGGVRYRFVDTAGLRETLDAIEAEGVRRAQRSIEGSDVLLYVYDVSLGLETEERVFLERMDRSHPEVSVLLVANKVDLVGKMDRVEEGWIGLSATRARRDAAELHPLLDRLAETARAGWSLSDTSAVVMNLRHRRHIGKALEAVRAAGAGLEHSIPAELLASDLRLALDEIGSITGEVTTEDVLGEIFSRFCIGK